MGKIISAITKPNCWPVSVYFGCGSGNHCICYVMCDIILCVNTTIDMMQCVVNASKILMSCVVNAIINVMSSEINESIIVMPFMGYVHIWM